MKEKQKLPYWIRERDLDFINDTQLDKIENIEKETSSNAKSFRRELYDHRTIISKSKRQYHALKNAEEEVKNSSSKLWTDLSPFKTKYSFTTCITIQRIEKEVKIGGEFGEKKIRKYEYFNLGINRPNQRKPVNIFLGTEKKFIDFLLKVYPLDKDEILKDWKEYCNKITGTTRYNPQQVIQSMMIENPKGFSGKSIKKEDVFVP